MENIYNDFDNESKSVIEELIQDNKKCNKLVEKLQAARVNIDKNVDVMKSSPTEKIK